MPVFYKILPGLMVMVEFVNLTPHEVVVFNEEGKEVLRIPPSGEVLRVETETVKVGEIEGVPVYALKYVRVGLPEEKEGRYYIVSSVVLNFLRGSKITRKDFLAPNTDKAIRDENGRIIGVVGFVRL